MNQEYGLRRWLVPIAVLTAISLGSFLTFYAYDVSADGYRTHFFAFDPVAVSQSLSSLAAMVAAVFGIVVTVVSIIVQLSADRYTGVARMFLRDRDEHDGVRLLPRGLRHVACGPASRCTSHFVPLRGDHRASSSPPRSASC